MKKPHLIITEQEHGIGLTGKCSACPESEFSFGMLGVSDDRREMIQRMFDSHFKEVHLREDASQAAARIVREATQQD